MELLKPNNKHEININKIDNNLHNNTDNNSITIILTI